MAKDDGKDREKIRLPDQLVNATFKYPGISRGTSAYMGAAEDAALKRAKEDAREWQKRVSAKLVKAYGSTDGIRREGETVLFADGSLTYEREPGPDEGPNTIAVLLEKRLNFTSIPAFAMDIAFAETPRAISYEIDSNAPQDDWLKLSELQDFELAGWDEGELTFKVNDLDLRISILETSTKIDVKPQGQFGSPPACRAAFGPEPMSLVLSGDASPWKRK